MKPKIYLFFLIFLFCCNIVKSQNNNDSNLIERFFSGRQQFQDSFDMFVDSIDLKFADYISKNWKEFNVEPPLQFPRKPEPKEMPVYNPQDSIAENLIIAVDSLFIEPAPRKEDKQEIEENNSVSVIDFFGTPLVFKPVRKCEKKLTEITGKQVADYWIQLSKIDYSIFIDDLIQKKSQLELNSWGLYRLILEWANVNYTKQQENEKVIFIVYILNKAGYKVKAGQFKNSLVIMMAIENNVYGLPYLKFNDGLYYILLDQTVTNVKISTYELSYQRVSMNIDLRTKTLPRFEDDTRAVKRKYNDKVYTFNYNNNLTNYYETFPLTDLKIYADTPLSVMAENSIINTFSHELLNKNAKEKVKFLLLFFQSALGYKTDSDQYGYDRCLFAEETLRNPYTDCQDRAILFCKIVKLLCGLDTVLVDYPTHVATAVKLNEPGDAIIYNNERYVVCDPTFSEAPIGKTMKGCDNTKATIVAAN